MPDHQVAEAVTGQQFHVFGEHGEQAAHQELGDGFGAVVVGFEALGEFGQLRGDLAGDARRLTAGIERERVGPDLTQTFAQFRLAQIVQRDAMAARVGKRRVGRTGAREFGVQLDAVADIHHHHERRAAFIGGQRAGVLLGLCARAQQTFVEAFGVLRCLELFGFQHERAATVQIDATGAGAAVAVREGDGTLEHVALFGRGMRRVDGKQMAEVDQETLRGGQLGRADAVPFGDESLCSLVAGDVARIWSHLGRRHGGPLRVWFGVRLGVTAQTMSRASPGSSIAARMPSAR